VSEVTTRKDLQQLEEQGYLTRVRGGAVVSASSSTSTKSAGWRNGRLNSSNRAAPSFWTAARPLFR
jgi:DeoR/GlpR family transcriptional regulator of sugar metabolism